MILTPPPKKRRRFFNINGWPMALISVVAVIRGITYFPTIFHGRPSGLETISATPALFAFYCTLWMVAGCAGLLSSLTGDRRFAISLIVGLCLVWGLGYAGQLLYDLFRCDVQSAQIYLGGATYLGFGAAVFRYPAKG